VSIGGFIGPIEGTDESTAQVSEGHAESWQRVTYFISEDCRPLRIPNVDDGRDPPVMRHNLSAQSREHSAPGVTTQGYVTELDNADDSFLNSRNEGVGVSVAS